MNPSGDPLFQHVFDFIKGNNLMSPHETVLVGVSGGADSVCMLHLLHRMRAELQIELHVAHLNHMLRGTESAEDAEYVKKLATRLDLVVTLEERDVRRYQRANRLSVEEAAREIRYQFLAEVADKTRAQCVAVGHTADDQAETVLMRLIRGAGPTGLQAMRPASEWKASLGRLMIVRPLLSVRREQTETYCLEHGLVPRFDPSNLSLSHFRNRVRHELIPLLQRYNPKINEALLRTADSLADELSLIEEMVSQAWPQVVEEDDASVSINREAILALHPALQRHLLRRVIKKCLGDLVDIEWKHVERLRSGMSLRKGKRVILPRKLTLHVGREWCRIATD